MRRVLLSWSSGKDSAWALHLLRQQRDAEVVALLTTFNESADRVAMHAVRRTLVDAQASAVGLPLWDVKLPHPCSNEEYQTRMRAVIAKARDAGITHVAFGDLFLEDVRDYRIRMLAGTGIDAIFPVWSSPDATATLAATMLGAGVKAILTCVDPKQLSPAFIGRRYDAALLAELPPSVDPCGERGEFHTFVWDAPGFSSPIPISIGEVVARDGFVFCDVEAAGVSGRVPADG